MKIAFVGAGAMGGLFAGYLARSQEEVWAYDVWKKHVDAINQDGLWMTRDGRDERVRLRATDDPTEPGIVDLVIVFVKYIHTRQAIQDARSLIDNHTAILTLQNGIGNVEILQEMLPDGQILFGLTTLTSELVGPGHIEESFKGQGETYIWPLNGKVDSRTEQISSIFNRAGIHTEISSDVQLKIWKKLIINSCLNTLTAITHLKVGDLVDQDETWPILNGIVSEIVQVAQKKDIPLDEEESRRFLRQIAAETRDHVPSMLVDVKHRRKTEIDCLNGAIIREGEKLGISTPTNHLLYRFIRIIENTYQRRVL